MKNWFTWVEFYAIIELLTNYWAVFKVKAWRNLISSYSLYSVAALKKMPNIATFGMDSLA